MIYCEAYMKLETLEQLVAGVKAKQQADPKVKGISLTIQVKDELDPYGNNLSAWVKQTDEQKAAKKDRFWVANGKCYWKDGGVFTQKELQEESPVTTSQREVMPTEAALF
tara:strand:+ start:7663 stop:7992 length:330 start_codon:yes stop_codon:yes gene_type:complete